MYGLVLISNDVQSDKFTLDINDVARHLLNLQSFWIVQTTKLAAQRAALIDLINCIHFYFLMKSTQ